jgi:hypothetical protein
MQPGNVLIFLCFVVAVFGQPTRTPWEYCRGPSTFTPNPYTADVQHGNIEEYTVADIPNANDSCWSPCGPSDSFCTSGDTIGVTSVSRLPGCWTLLDFTYFRTYVNVPADVDVTQFTIDFTLMDDGSRVSIVNTQNPTGLVIAGSYVYLDNAATVNLASYITTGSNLVLITQVDDCAVGNNINGVVSLNGNTIPPTCVPQDQCHTAAVNSLNICVQTAVADKTPCDDGNSCTLKSACISGVCTGSKPVVCKCGACDSSTGLCVKNSKRKRNLM